MAQGFGQVGVVRLSGQGGVPFKVWNVVNVINPQKGLKTRPQYPESPRHLKSGIYIRTLIFEGILFNEVSLLGCLRTLMPSMPSCPHA